MCHANSKLSVRNKIFELSSCLLEEESTQEFDPDRANEDGMVSSSGLAEADEFACMPGPGSSKMSAGMNNVGEPCSSQGWKMREENGGPSS